MKSVAQLYRVENKSETMRERQLDQNPSIAQHLREQGLQSY